MKTTLLAAEEVLRRFNVTERTLGVGRAITAPELARVIDEALWRIAKSDTAQLPVEVPHHPHAGETSREAAESMEGAASSQLSAVRDFLQQQGPVGATCEEVELALGLKHSSASARLWFLRYRAREIVSLGYRQTTANRRAEVLIMKEFLPQRAAQFTS